jgi:hypothetical protein
LKFQEWQSLAHSAIRDRKALPGLFEAGEGNLRIYQNAFRIRVRAAIRDDFQLLERLVGRSEMLSLVEAFLLTDRDYRVEPGLLGPAFFRFLEKKGARATILRAARLGLLEVAARKAAEPEAGGKLFGLHPSASLLADGRRFFVVWREDGFVRRERLRAQDYTFLRCFAVKAELAEISARLELAGLSQAFVQDSAALWTKLGLLGSAIG